jgi:hypothetical protein
MFYESPRFMFNLNNVGEIPNDFSFTISILVYPSGLVIEILF